MYRRFPMGRPARPHARNQNTRNQNTHKIGFEQCESRQMMSVNPLLANVAVNTPLVFEPVDPPIQVAAGSIHFNTSNGFLTIDGSDHHADKVQVYINHRSGNGAGTLPDLFTVQLSNSAGSPQVRAFNIGQVTRVFVNGYGGNDFIDNRTNVPMTARGGLGSDVLMGGAVDDLLTGGAGHDFIDGRLGNDTIFGEAGNDKLFGDVGIDFIYGGADNDFIFGGHGDDDLRGEAGDDVIFGGLGADILRDTVGTNRLVADYGDVPSRIPTIASFRQFYTFDMNFKDPAARSLARLGYRDMSMDRTDVMSVLNVIATNGKESVLPFNGSVSTNEFHDMKLLLNTNWPLKMRSDVRYLTTAIVNGNTANANYQGAALGNVAAGSQGQVLTKLVDKWFKGGDLPVATGFSTLRYERVAGSLFVNGPSHTDIDQGNLNNCYFVAALGEVAQHSPSTIKNMFRDNGDGTFSVRFFLDGKSAFVTVNRMLPVLGHGFSAPVGAGWGFDSNGWQRTANDAANELWVALAEKAYAQINESGKIGQDGTNTYAGTDFGHAKSAFKHITNQTATDVKFGDNKSDLLKAVNAGKAIGLSSKADNTASNIVENHVYMLVGYNSVTDKFELRNPHGADSASSTPMTVFVSFSDLKASFDKWTSVLV